MIIEVVLVRKWSTSGGLIIALMVRAETREKTWELAMVKEERGKQALSEQGNLHDEKGESVLVLYMDFDVATMSWELLRSWG